MANLLITGGAGFVGSHTCLALLLAGHRLLALDNFANSGPEALRRVAELAALQPLVATGHGSWATADQRLSLRQGDVRSRRDLDPVFAAEPIDGVLHFAGLKAVAESISQPLQYWDVNVAGSVCLLQAMEAGGCRTLVFSSSATLYGHPERLPIAEAAPIQPINPYGQTKAAVEQLLADVAASQPAWRIARLRYFNPVAAHPSGRLGEDPHGMPSNIFPLISQVAMGLRPVLEVFGSDWPTADGTGVRDYIHVMDLAEGHSATLALLLAEAPQLLTLNLGSGQGHSVLDLVNAFAAASGQPIPIRLSARRAGDSAASIADPGAAERRLGWRTRRGLAEICRDGWAWQQANPQGYGA